MKAHDTLQCVYARPVSRRQGRTIVCMSRTTLSCSGPIPALHRGSWSAGTNTVLKSRTAWRAHLHPPPFCQIGVIHASRRPASVSHAGATQREGGGGCLWTGQPRFADARMHIHWASYGAKKLRQSLICTRHACLACKVSAPCARGHCDLLWLQALWHQYAHVLASHWPGLFILLYPYSYRLRWEGHPPWVALCGSSSHKGTL